MTVLVTGAAGGQQGKTGRRVTELLRARDIPVRAMVRTDDDRAEYLRGLGAEVVVQFISYTALCPNIASPFRDRDQARVSQTRCPGQSRVYGRVLHEGELAGSDPAQILSPDEARVAIRSR